MLENVAVVTAAILGSTGLASLIASGWQLSRASRLKKAAADMEAVVGMHRDGTVEFDSASHALKVITLELVAARLVRLGSREVFALCRGVVVVAIVFICLFVFPNEGMRSARDLLLSPVGLSLAASYMVAFASTFWFLLSRQRERAVAELLLANKFDPNLFLRHSPFLRAEKRLKYFQVARRRSRRPPKDHTKGVSDRHRDE